MLTKADLLLLLLDANERELVRGKTRLVKLIYIASKKLRKHLPVYEFRWYYYGPFSNDLVNDLEILAEEGLIDHSEELLGSQYGRFIENVYSITREGGHALDEKRSDRYFEYARDILSEVKKRYNDIPLSMLINEVYFKYPLEG